MAINQSLIVQVIALAACVLLVNCSPTRTLQPTPPGLDVSASADLVGSPDTIRVRLRVVNVAESEQTVQWFLCPWTGAPEAIRAYEPQSNRRAWDWEAASAQSHVACFLNLYYDTIQPGDSAIIWGRAAASDILGDSLAPGAYDLTLTPKNLEPSYPVELPLGEFTLKR